MASNVASKQVASKWNNFYASAKLYFTRHPIIGGYVLMGIPFCIDWLRRYNQLDPLFESVHKYRRYNIVLRPDDPAAKLVKRWEVGFDRV